MKYALQAWAVVRNTALALIVLSVPSGLVYALYSERQLPPISLQHLQQSDNLFAAGDFESAAEQYAIAASIAPDDDRVLYRLGVALQQLGDLEGAMDAYRRSLRLEPRNKFGYF